MRVDYEVHTPTHHLQYATALPSPPEHDDCPVPLVVTPVAHA